MTRSAGISRTPPFLRQAFLRQGVTNSSFPLGAARTLVGATLLARPTLLAKSLGVDAATAEHTAWIARFFASRDLALGVGCLTGSRGFALAGCASDLSDFFAVVAAIKAKHVKALPGAFVAMTAGGAAAIGGASLLVTRE